jgi:hypothetical protein
MTTISQKVEVSEEAISPFYQRWKIVEFALSYGMIFAQTVIAFILAS